MAKKYFEVMREYREKIGEGFECYCKCEIFLPWRARNPNNIFRESFYVCSKCGQVFSTTYTYRWVDLKKVNKDGDDTKKEEFLVTRIWDYKCSKEVLDKLRQKYKKELKEIAE